MGQAVLALLETRDHASADFGAWRDPFAVTDAFELTGERRLQVSIEVDGEPGKAVVRWVDGRAEVLDTTGAILSAAGADVRRCGNIAYAIEAGRAVRVALVDQLSRVAEDEGGAAAIKAPMHGKVIAVDVAAGDTVAKGQRIAVVEAMKMEHAIVAPRDGVVESVLVSEGGQVDQGASVATLAEE